ncbi:XRE family transcriptional regulator [Rhodoferax sp.]|uniref:helix-turn-helix domain-containing protein n=1 Tax=Rhodoferax sp. TaxID=50421 RepID=UPI0028490AD6|nr:XRE family transcriptional regulator [Rhodoferax sp.]MDR3372051.1 XRE family transcriptional regulator [Rhodoferax sp.]
MKIAKDTHTGPLPAIAAALRREREQVGLSISELARKSGVAKSTLSQLEAGVGNPSLESLWALAMGLNVPFSRLLDPQTVQVQVVRASEGMIARAADAAYEAVLLSVCPQRVRRDIYRIHFEPGITKTSVPHAAGTVEHVILTSGKARLGPVGKTIELLPGDYASYAGDVAHSYEANEPDTRAILIVEYP